ncbi:hypothetical protein PLICRDRAFT_406381 [Plicaturopsis crispa FD-325 SS-3]|nr:hypothetical protein PLICRDRAFT_406381 [Plicaturopsis crispa FD-325 SS-3]
MNTTIPAPTTEHAREEWADDDFDFPEGQALQGLDHESDKEDEDGEDWDMEMSLGKTGGAKAKAVVDGMVARQRLSLEGAHPASSSTSQMITIRPPLTLSDDDNDEEDEEGVSTIKVGQLPKAKPLSAGPVDEDIESAFALPSDLTQLSLAPLSLAHRSSKNSLEWGDKDHTSSSQSSDAYSTLGFADASPSSNSTTSASLPDSETDDDDEGDESELDGLVIPNGIFESGRGGKQLTKILEMKKKVKIEDDPVKFPSPDPEDDFEMGLVIDDSVELSASRLLLGAKEQSNRLITNRSKSLPPRYPQPSSLRPPSRLKAERAKSPVNPPPSSLRQLQKIRLSPSPPLRPTPPTRSQTCQPVSSAPPSASASFLSPKPGSVRGQKSHSALKPPTPPSTQRKLSRKASLSSLIEASNSQASGSGTASSSASGSSSRLARYEAPTAASRAKAHTHSTSRMHGLEYIVPPTRPSTPSSNPAALRLTMPTTLRLKSRPSISSVFPSPSSATFQRPERSESPGVGRPPSSLSVRARAAAALANTPPKPPAPKVLRKPKRQRTYGDGTELDGFEDLPTDRDQEGRYRVVPKGYGNRIPGGSYSSRTSDTSSRGSPRKKTRRDSSTSGTSAAENLPLPITPPGTLKQTGRIVSSSKIPKKKKDAPSPLKHTKRKPTLIRNLGGAGAPKVVGDMKWNPHTLRWEGNDQALRDFDAAVGTSTRPALITHLTGSSIGSPVGSFANGARVVGNMIFDPAKMCWISTLPPDEDEPDVFADLADDEDDDDAWEAKGGTIRASQQATAASDVTATTAGSSSINTSSNTSSVRLESPSPARSHSHTPSESGSDRGSRESLLVCDVDDDFLESCRRAEERNRVEMRAWRRMRTSSGDGEPDRSSLYEIRALATRNY